MSGLLLHPAARITPLVLQANEPSWYAIHTMARHEKRVASQLQEKRITTFLPLLAEVHRWSDRRRKVEVPLFSCYAFVQVLPTPEKRVQVLQIPGVLGFVGSEKQGTAIPDAEIENLQSAIEKKAFFAIHPFVNVGARVRIRGGALDGLEGILVRQSGSDSLLISVTLLQRSVSVRVEGYEIELV